MTMEGGSQHLPLTDGKLPAFAEEALRQVVVKKEICTYDASAACKDTCAPAVASAKIEVANAVEKKLALRRHLADVASVRHNAATLRTLDSSLRKIMPFLKKMRERFGEDTRAQLVQEAQKLNLTKYVEEVAMCIAESKLKLNDIPAVVELCFTLHALYATFTPSLLPLLRRNATLLPPPPSRPGADQETDSERAARLFRRRATLIVLFELLAVGVIEEASQVLSCLQDVVNEDLVPTEAHCRVRKHDAFAMPNIVVVSSLAKHICSDPLMLPPVAAAKPCIPGAREGAAPVDTDGESAHGADVDSETHRCALDEAEQLALRELLERYFQECCTCVQSAFDTFHEMERLNQRTLSSRGELTDGQTAKYDRAKENFERLSCGCATLAKALGTSMPLLQEETLRVEKAVASISVVAMSGDEKLDGTPYDDVEARSFYEQLPDLKSMLPPILFDTPDEKKEESADAQSKASIEELLKQLLRINMTSVDIDELASECICRGARYRQVQIVGALAHPSRRHPECLPRYARFAAILASCFGSMGTELTNIVLDELGQLCNAQLQKNGSEASFVAAATSWSPLPSPRRVRDHSRTRQQELAAALHTAQYTAELVKFRLVEPASVFAIMKGLLEDFSQANVAVVCCLLERCGKTLYYSRETQVRCEAILALLAKLRSTRKLPYELAVLIDNAIGRCKPPQMSAIVEDQRPTLKRYIDYVIHNQLSRLSLERVVHQLRKLPWRAGPGATHVVRWIIASLLDCACEKYHAIPMIACVLSALAHHYENEMLRALDTALNLARCTVDRDDSREAQRRLSVMKLLGELYNYALLDSSMVFRMLYVVVPRGAGMQMGKVRVAHVPAHAELVFGLQTEAICDGMGEDRPLAIIEDPDLRSKADYCRSLAELPAQPHSREPVHSAEPCADGLEDHARLRCACTLLAACGSYFSCGSTKRRLDLFLIHLQHYTLCKAKTGDVDGAFSDMLASLRPGTVRLATYREACEVMGALETVANAQHAEDLAYEYLQRALERAEEEVADKQVKFGDEHERKHKILAKDDIKSTEVELSRDDGLIEETRRVADAGQAIAFTFKVSSVASLEEEEEFHQMMSAVVDAKPAIRKAGLLPKIAPQLLSSMAMKKSTVESTTMPNTTSVEGVMTLRVLHRAQGKMQKLEAAQVNVPTHDTLGECVLPAAHVLTPQVLSTGISFPLLCQPILSFHVNSLSSAGTQNVLVR